MSHEYLAMDKLDENQEVRDGARYAQLSILRKNANYNHR